MGIIIENDSYANLPEDLLAKILEHVPKTVDKMNKMFNIQDKPLEDGISELKKLNKIVKLVGKEYSTSLIAVDGSVIVEKMTGSDLLLAVAVGVEGLTTNTSIDWGKDNNQYYQWQTILSHNEANARLAQGVMFLMELSVLASAKHEVRIMDGTHFTPILKINSMLSAKDEDTSGREYAGALSDFLRETYEKIIPDIPDIINSALNKDQSVIALAKYSSSRDVIDALLKKCNITIDDRTFFSLKLQEDEYLTPLTVGQSVEERERIWNDLHIKCNLEIPEKGRLNTALEQAIEPLTTKNKASKLYYTYYKPYADGVAYRIELKEALATNKEQLEKCLLSIKKQIIFPQIREPYPQYLVDIMAKGISTGMSAIQEAIRLSPDLKIDKGKFNLLFNYRTK